MRFAAGQGQGQRQRQGQGQRQRQRQEQERRTERETKRGTAGKRRAESTKKAGIAAGLHIISGNVLEFPCEGRSAEDGCV